MSTTATASTIRLNRSLANWPRNVRASGNLSQDGRVLAYISLAEALNWRDLDVIFLMNFIDMNYIEVFLSFTSY
jgi:hypothetical protein